MNECLANLINLIMMEEFCTKKRTQFFCTFRKQCQTFLGMAANYLCKTTHLISILHAPLRCTNAITGYARLFRRKWHVTQQIKRMMITKLIERIPSLVYNLAHSPYRTTSHPETRLLFDFYLKGVCVHCSGLKAIFTFVHSQMQL